MTDRAANEPGPEQEGPRDGPGEAFRLLFVCTGNTCRSPLAEALARRGLERRGWRHVEVRSAGVSAGEGGPASSGARRAAERHGLDLGSHRSAPLSATAVRRADLVLTMSAGHLAAVEMYGGEGKASVITEFAKGEEGAGLSPSGGVGVPDPVGGGDEAYEATYRALARLVTQVLDRLEPMVSP